MTPEFITVITILAGSAAIWTFATKVAEIIAGRQKSAVDIATGLTGTLWQEIERLNAETRALEARCDALEADIATERERSSGEHDARIEAERLASELAEKNDRLEGECAQMKRRIAALEREVQDLRGAARGKMDDPLQG
jgi:chromosome segregation ATPase